MSAIIYQIPNADKALIPDPKEALVYPFDAGAWLDLRLGAFISITTLASNDDQGNASIAESLATAGVPGDRVFMGLTANNVLLGLSNSGVTEGSTPSVVEADPVDTTKRWRYKGIAGKAIVARDGITVGGNITQDNAAAIFGPELCKNPDPTAGTGGRANLFMLRITRPSSTSLTLTTAYAKTNRSGADYADANVFSDNPTIGLIRQNFRSATWTAGLPAILFATVPNELLFYWPFMNSRLRIHSLCIEKFA